MLESFQIMQWPLLACLLLPGLLVYLGLHIVEREIIFVDLSLAQVAALGTCLGILMHHEADSWESYALSLGFTLVGAGIFTFTRTKSHRVPQEALIGIVYVVTAALGILLLSRSPEGNEELRRTLIGEVLLVTPAQVLRTFGLFVAIGLVHWFFRAKFLALSFDPDGATAREMSIHWWDFAFYAMFGWVVTSFVQIGGVLLVFSFLIVPAVCANFLAETLRSRLLIGWVTATLASVIGLYASYAIDLPTGAAIVCALGLALLGTIAAASLRKGRVL